MNTVIITLELPEDVVQDARKLDVLNSESIARFLKAEIARRGHVNDTNGEVDQAELDRRQAAREFLKLAEELSTIEPRMTEEKIKAEIAAMRRGDPDE